LAGSLSIVNSLVKPQLAYLIGLIVGRGRLFDLGRIVIEFSHSNETINGIAHCPKCNAVATQKNSFYSCKNPKCGAKGFVPKQEVYNQQVETKASIQDAIVPFLGQGLEFKYYVMGSPSVSQLVLDFETKKSDWTTLAELFGKEFHFHTGSIPKEIASYNFECKVEFVNGLLDSAGFCNAGGWVPRKGIGSEVRQRAYFQVVRNWKLVVEIDNFLRHEFKIPIQTIDWGHPNIRDGNLVEAQAGKSSAFAREHQLKIYPEYMKAFKFRISSKQKMFQELIDHNIKGGFENKEDWFPPKKITSFKAIHPDEVNPRLALPVRRHFDSFWQINLALGCSYLNDLAKTAKNSEVFSLNGDLLDPGPASKVQASIDKRRAVVKIKTYPPTAKAKKAKAAKRGVRAKEDLELATYPILKEYFDKKYFSEISDGEFHITNYSTLSGFMKDQPPEFVALFEECEAYRIRPDLVGFDVRDSSFIFIESKVEPLDMRMLGQLIGYCLVAQPKEAFLLSTQSLSPRLVNAVSANPDVLNYSAGCKIQIGQIIGKDVVIHDI
jgi:hypothetical protein